MVMLKNKGLVSLPSLSPLLTKLVECLSLPFVQANL